MEKLLPVINRLQDVTVTVGLRTSSNIHLDLPQIAVVGSQSVGKSSVLEAFVGRDFLPRGSGIVTRRPLILQLRNIKGAALYSSKSLNNKQSDKPRPLDPPSPKNSSLVKGTPTPDGASRYVSNASPTTSSPPTSEDFSIPPSGAEQDFPEEWGEFSHRPGVIFDDFDEIRREIELETDRVTGKNKGISHQPILLKIFSPKVVDLTLIDLPGITKVPVGDQPLDIEQQIRKMIYYFISKPNTIILAVSAANTDLANSDALQLAREVDPEGRRTIGVITKCDLMDDGTDALDMLLGRIYPLQRGYVGVVCRSQRGIDSRLSMRVAIEEEKRYFASHPAYHTISHRCGTQFLAVLLNQILLSHIHESLPELRRRIQALILEYEAETASYGGAADLDTYGNKGALLLHVFSKFSRNFQDSIDGRLCATHVSNQLTGGARIRYIFHDLFGKSLAQLNALEGMSDMEIRAAIRNSTGPKASLFVPEGAFEILVRKQIAKLEQPALQCVDQVYEELQRIAEHCEVAEAFRFQVLRDRIVEIARILLRKSLGPTNQMISNLIQMELAYLNTQHPDFLGGNSASYSRIASALLLSPGSFPGQHPLHLCPPALNPSPCQQAPNSARDISTHHSVYGGARMARPALQGNTPDVLKPQSFQQPYLAPPSIPATPIVPPSDMGPTTIAQPGAPLPQDTPHAASNAPPLMLSAGSGSPHLTGSGAQQQPPVTSSGTGGLLSFLRGMPKPSNGVSNSDGASANLYQPTPAHPTLATPSQATSLRKPGISEAPLQSATSQTTKIAHTSRHSLVSSSFSGHTILPSLRLPQVPSTVTPPDVPSEREKIEIELIKLLISSYFNIVRKNVADYVPKTVMSFMVNAAKDALQRELVGQLYKEDLFDDLFRESDEIAQSRERCNVALSTLRTALEIVNQLKNSTWDD